MPSWPCSPLARSLAPWRQRRIASFCSRFNSRPGRRFFPWRGSAGLGVALVAVLGQGAAVGFWWRIWARRPAASWLNWALTRFAIRRLRPSGFGGCVRLGRQSLRSVACAGWLRLWAAWFRSGIRLKQSNRWRQQEVVKLLPINKRSPVICATSYFPGASCAFLIQAKR